MKRLLNSILFTFMLLLAFVFVGCKKEEKPLHSYTSYFHTETCEICGEDGTLESKRLYDDVVVYTYTDEKYAKFQTDYQNVLTTLNKVGSYDKATHAFIKDSTLYIDEEKFEEDIYNVFDEDCNEIVAQYQYATIREDMDSTSEKAEQDMDTISDYYNEAIEKYYSLYQKIYDSAYREYFYSEEDGWTEDEILQVLHEAAPYANEEYVKIKNENDKLEQQLDNISDISSSEVLDIYEKFFENNKKLAEIEGATNYMDQAYKYTYGREYTPSDIQAKVNKYKELGVEFYKFYNALPKYSLKTSERKIAEALLDKSPLETQLANDYVYNFFKTMKYENGDYKVDFEALLEKTFEDGAYFKGDEKQAYSWYLEGIDTPIMFFGPGYYSASFTFVHEFGHHNNSSLNTNNDYEVDSMDLNETHSQGDEMMLLSYLLEQDVSDNLKNYVISEEIGNMLQIIVLAAAVDIFEQAIYTNTYTLANSSYIMADGQISKNEYDSVFVGILSSFGVSKLFNNNYWRYVCLSSPCYYISYSISALESLQVFFEYQDNGYEAAKNKYMKLLDYVTLKQEDMTYVDVLEYASFATYEEDELYDDAINFMKKFVAK